MSCFENYIGLHRTLRTSISGLYVTGLMGVELSVFDSLAKEEQEDFEELWLEVYQRAQINFVTDLTTLLKKKFLISGKIITREASEFLPEFNFGTGDAGLKLTVDLTKYMVIEILNISFIADVAYQSPPLVIRVYDKDMALLDTISVEAVEGKNVVNYYKQFTDETLFFLYDKDAYDLRSTINRYYNDGRYAKLECTFPCYYGEGAIYQQNGGGLNINFVVTCSVEKFLCENLSIFKNALWYKTGVELMRERITSDRVNHYTTLSTERATQLLAEYTSDFDKAAAAAVDTLKIEEDPICFSCKSFATQQNYLP